MPTAAHRRSALIRLVRAALAVFVLLSATTLWAEDIDIFTSAGAGSAGAPNIIFLVDNSANWARASQRWPDTSGNQGESEMLALKNVISSLSASTPINIGLAMYNKTGSTYGGYIRFGARDMSIAANKTALQNILDGIRADVNSPLEKVAQNDGEAASLYEIYKYFKNATPFLGGAVAINPNLDIAGNAGGRTPYTTVAQGLTSGFAIDAAKYLSPAGVGSCGRSYVVLIANNANGVYPPGAQSFESVSAGASIAGTTASWTDEWARFLYRSGIGVYVLDAFNAQKNTAYSNVLKSAATNAGGKYFQVGNQVAIESALKQILAEVQSVNSTFTTVSLPISATNRAQSLNQVFIGMFRPDPDGMPRWMGNLKQYQLINEGTEIGLGDALGQTALNLQTGFIAECAASFWTKDSGSYWSDVPINPVPSSTCTAFPTVDGLTGSIWSDLPDGSRVEKGGVAEVLRQGNNPPTTYTLPTWVSNRTLLTHATGSTSLVSFSAATTGLSAGLVDWVKGREDVAALEKLSGTATSTRPSLHGDVIHSRPLPVNYGGGTGVTVFYGANDGMFRSVDASTGRERWALVAPESHAKFQRLHDNSPMVSYATMPAGITPTPQPKDYFFDGSIGLYQNADNSKVWIFPSMRRGGRMVSALDVTDPASPLLKWRVGCPSLTVDAGCTAGFSAIGQTWSVPNVAFLKGYSSTTPVLIFGGGYDSCEDANSAAPVCGSRKGNAIFVVDANSGALIRTFTTAGSVSADVALADVNTDGSVDYAYASDTTGNIYRIDFSDTSGATLASGGWEIRKVAYTAGSGRKFLYPPALFNTVGKMYLALGSGDREHPLASHYPFTAPITNRLYVYLDDLSVAAGSAIAATNLDTDVNIANYTAAAGSSCSLAGVTPRSGLKGWYMDLSSGVGEQTITSALIASGMVTFNTNRPTPPAAASCTNPLGESRGYWVNLLNGSGGIGTTNASCGGDRSTLFVGGGLTPSPTIATVAVGSAVVTVVVGAVRRGGGASSGISPQRITPSVPSRRRILYWKSKAAND